MKEIKILGLRAVVAPLLMVCAVSVCAGEVNTTANISVGFTPGYDYPAPQPQALSAEVGLSFTPAYPVIEPPVEAVSAEIAATFTPQAYPAAYEDQSGDAMVSVVNQNTPVPVETVPLADGRAVVALAAASGLELTLASGLYDLGPDGTVFSPAAEIVFKYEESALNGLDEGLLDVYRYDEGSGWVKLEVLQRNTEENWLAVKTDHLCLFGVFYTTATSPAAFLSVNGYVVASGSGAYIAQADTITLTGNALASSLAYTVDAEFSAHAAITYTLPFTLPVGAHTVYYAAFDNMGNQGEVRDALITVSGAQGLLPIAPSSGPIGVPFAITGEGFGSYAANYTKVMIGGVSVPLTQWSTGAIKGTIPGILAVGEHAVMVMRGTTTIANAAPFTVLAPSAAGVSPSSGAIGVPFTINGANFGNYVANQTRVLIGGATAPLTLWTDTQIKGTVPGALAAGDYELVVERALNGGFSATQPLAFKVLTPELYAIIPTSGSIGVGFTLTGANFGNYVANYTRVLIGGTTCPLTLWTDGQIKGTVPGTLASGTYEVAVERELNGGLARSATVAFTLNAPSVAAVLPSSGAIGVPFTINGATFGNYVANYTKVLIGGTTCPLTLWTDTRIKGTVPGSLAAGEHELTVVRELNGGLVTTLPVPFTVLLPDWSAVMPSSGPIGLPFTLNGANFGNYVANYTKVLIGGAAAPLTLWTDSQIKGTVPGTLAEGAHEAYVERALNGGVVRSSTFSFTVGKPYLDTISPSTAAVIAPFTITGYNFGNYVANYTRVLIGGATCPLTLWTETKIQGKLPFLPAGEYPVLVQRNLNGGLNESATAYLTVVAPVISSMTPQSGAVGTVFNLYGTGFGPYDASIAKVFMGGTQCALSLWTDTQIRGTVPSGLSYATHTVVAMRGGASSNALEFYIPVYTPSLLRAGALSQEFRLGEVYVYPDPAKGGKVPTFHIEVGTADTVKLRVYTVAGQLAHERVLTGEPQAVGAGYAYEYAWQGRIASGVYYYTVEAERTGRKLKARGKFAVVR